ncbi:outer membrane lipoprotein carrier protein LolA [candidate division CSSED10-310 bacterium]|uniref:Outer membrane lipoprotein carrier protein LolA n=1 Tax=candidate division CSSED10-310 bacterium TaxID=2855610 RepID=A0ABV6Z308_UNCC1
MIKVMKHLFWIMICLLPLASLTFVLAADSEQEKIAEILSKVKSEYEAVKTLKTEFQQESFQSILQETRLENGWLAIQKPEKMVWKYKEPTQKTALLDGTYVWLYNAADHHLYREKYDQFAQNMFYQLISGNIVLDKEFQVSFWKGEQKDNQKVKEQLKLVPITTHRTISHIVVTIAEASFFISQTTVYDHYGNKTTCSFSNYSINPQLEDDVFRLTIPEKVIFTDFTGHKLETAELKNSPTLKLE